MTKLTIAEAAKRSGVTRPTFNNRYVKTGLITVFEENGKKYVKTASLTKILTQTKKKTSTTKTTAASKKKTQQVAKPPPQPPAKRTKSSTAKPKATAVKMTDIEKLKLQVKKLRAALKAATTDNESLQQQNESLKRKNASLTSKLGSSSVKPKAKVKATTQTKLKPVILTIPKLDTDPKPSPKTDARRQKSVSENEHWVDKWWDRF